MNDPSPPLRWRYERFGGIVASESPPFLAFVNRAMMRSLGLRDSSLWQGEDDGVVDLLSAPTEVHLAATGACSLGCPHCYMASAAPLPGELDTAGMKRALEVLAELGVFHVALGGGEALLRPDLLELGEHARACGLVPNLTVSGHGLTPEVARGLAASFGQVNVSLDGIGPASAVHRGRDGFAPATRALQLLAGAGLRTGINCVLGRENFDQLPGLFRHAADLGLSEIELLRFKPAGRGKDRYDRARCTPDQHLQLVPLLLELSAERGVAAKIDCSFVPMLCAHRPPPELLAALATCGCEAGNLLLGVSSDGRVSGCSFLPPTELRVVDLPGSLTRDPVLASLRRSHLRLPEPCASCDYLDLCKGGCRAVALHVRGTMAAPDPECPLVVARTAVGGRP